MLQVSMQAMRITLQGLEEEVVPLYYDRAPNGLPHNWITMMKRLCRRSYLPITRQNG